ncbi:LysR family transcriptional regulator [Mesorhizobium hawassense]|uniref:LysR family transcriptional regulator n=1 Tax=Mesorhizobium hawassense TaxID=1209954 RepID=A0A330HZJ7_9HYPH|nr:LysR family transcriptional regulator [Mesorhizobium hawassense]RAZ92444.1 LysR family transcriptional regulator [Mesorhizobium hawassense]
MEMQQVRYFLALSNTLNFTRAAEECNVTQPALTRAIKTLEDELGGELLRRERQHSHLTELGRRMLPLLQQCYDAATSAKSLAKAVQSSEVAPLNVTISNSVNIALLVSTFTELFRAYPGVHLKINRGSPGAVIEALKEGQAELAVAGPLGQAWDRLDVWPLFQEGIELAVNADHPLARRNEADVDLSQLAAEPVLSRIYWETSEELWRCLSAKGYTPRTAHEVENDQDLLALLEANVGIGFVSLTSPRSANSRRLKLRDLDVSRIVSVYAVAGRLRSPVATTLLNLLRAADWSTFGVSEPA